MVLERFFSPAWIRMNPDGYDLELTAAISDAVSIPVIASGGVGTLDHLYDGLAVGHAHAVLAASIFHYRTYTIQQAKQICTIGEFRSVWQRCERGFR